MKRLSLPLLLFLFIVSSFHCSKSKRGGCSDVAFRSLDTDVNECTFMLDGNDNNVFLTINSSEELQSHGAFSNSEPLPLPLPCDVLMNIDFTRYTLLLGQQFTPNIPSALVSQQVQRNCTSGKITYTVRYSYGGFTQTGIFRFAVLIPKESAGTPIELNIVGKQDF